MAGLRPVQHDPPALLGKHTVSGSTADESTEAPPGGSGPTQSPLTRARLTHEPREASMSFHPVNVHKINLVRLEKKEEV